MDEHVCHCESCAPMWRPAERVSEGHAAVRFGDSRTFRVLEDGRDVPNVTEALIGPDGHGWIDQFRGDGDAEGPNLHRCRSCGRAPCQRRRWGFFRLEAASHGEQPS